jgi:hypothetical protein
MIGPDRRLPPAVWPDGLAVASRLFQVEPAVFLRALHVAPVPAEAKQSLKQLRDALWRLRSIVPDEVLPRWIVTKLPRHLESPLDILNGENGFTEFLRLIDSINHGDFA